MTLSPFDYTSTSKVKDEPNTGKVKDEPKTADDKKDPNDDWAQWAEFMKHQVICQPPSLSDTPLLL